MPFVYFIHEDNCNNVFKIGKTENHPADRLDQLQTGNPRRLRIYRWIEIPGHSTAEEYLHMRHHSARIRGEWYKISMEQIDEDCAIILSSNSDVIVSNEWEQFTDADRLKIKVERQKRGKYKGKRDPCIANAAKINYLERSGLQKIINIIGFSDEQ